MANNHSLKLASLFQCSNNVKLELSVLISRFPMTTYFKQILKVYIHYYNGPAVDWDVGFAYLCMTLSHE